MSQISTDLEKTKQLLKLLIAIDVPMPLVAEMLAPSNKLDIHLLRYLGGPAGKLPNGQKTSLPKWLVKTIYLERVDLVFNESAEGKIGELATPAEVLAVINTIFQKYQGTGESPFESIWYELQIWCFQQSTHRFDIAQNLKLPEIDYAHIAKAYEVLARQIRKNVVANSQVSEYARKQA
jgi:hypothetical protein